MVTLIWADDGAGKRANGIKKSADLKSRLKFQRAGNLIHHLLVVGTVSIPLSGGARNKRMTAFSASTCWTFHELLGFR